MVEMGHFWVLSKEVAWFYLCLHCSSIGDTAVNKIDTNIWWHGDLILVLKKYPGYCSEEKGVEQTGLWKD